MLKSNLINATISAACFYGSGVAKSYAKSKQNEDPFKAGILDGLSKGLQFYAILSGLKLCLGN